MTTLFRSPIDSKIAAKLMFAYSPKAQNEASCFNISEAVQNKEAQQATIKGIRVVKVSDMKEAILYIGGVKVWLWVQYIYSVAGNLSSFLRIYAF